MDQQSILLSLEVKGPEAWLAYVHAAEEGSPATALSMQVVFGYAAPLAKAEESIMWAEVAVRAAELDARSCAGLERENALLNAMSLRSWFIARMGSRLGHIVLDKATIIRWAEGGLTIPAQTAREKAKSYWGNLERAKTSSNPADIQRMAEDIHLLRWIKHRIRLVKVLADSGEIPIESLFREWLPLYEILP